MVYEQIAAVDLGSNSFRLQIGRVVDDQIYPLDTLKESVRLAAGLTREKLLDEAAQQRALESLSRFGERLRGFQPEAQCAAPPVPRRSCSASVSAVSSRSLCSSTGC